MILCFSPVFRYRNSEYSIPYYLHRLSTSYTSILHISFFTMYLVGDTMSIHGHKILQNSIAMLFNTLHTNILTIYLAIAMYFSGICYSQYVTLALSSPIQLINCRACGPTVNSTSLIITLSLRSYRKGTNELLEKLQFFYCHIFHFRNISLIFLEYRYAHLLP